MAPFMTDATARAIVAAVPPTLAALGSWRASHRAAAGVMRVEVVVNGRMDALLAEVARLKGETPAAVPVPVVRE